jgi:dTDP-3-amino-2,3,6-trideoxy-4-keto-D-glucose/dTDP-3-amino-3,4,6-trideoxy-alpha-D-glucose/dTDP-2,6-dideoxy-D-kanosamine transaminase
VQDVIPLNDLARTTVELRPAINDAIARVLDRGYFVLGPENAALEAELADFVGVSEAVTVGNGTDALQIALAASGVNAGDLVVSVANAGGYTTTAARLLGAKMIYADVDPHSLLMTAETFQNALARAPRRPAAVVVTHLFGVGADVIRISQIARDAGIAVIEDCAQALGGTSDGRRLGSFGTAATTSFYPTKNLGAVGDAGAVLTSDPEVAARARMLRQYGWNRKYHVATEGGMNSRMDEIQAAVIRAKLPHLDGWNRRRTSIHRQYEAAAGAGMRFVTHASDEATGHLAVIEVNDRERMRAAFTELGIGTDVHYPVPDHRQAAGAVSVHLPVTERAAERIVSIPLFPELRVDEIDRICAALRTV